MFILLLCAAGMSTSMLVERMKKAAEADGIADLTIEAHSVSELNKYADKVDVILLGPQVRFQESTVKSAVAGRIPVDVIDMKDYGLMNGEAVLKSALKLIEDFKA